MKPPAECVSIKELNSKLKFLNSKFMMSNLSESRLT